MSGAIVSSFPNQNILYGMATGATGLSLQHSQNELMQQQQDISSHDIAMTGQAAAGLLGMSEEDAARAYPGVIQGLQSYGYAKQAPTSYPGHAATQALVQRALPILDQYKMGYISDPGSEALVRSVFGGGTGPTTGGTATGGAPPATTAQPSVPAYGGGTGNLPVPQEYMPYFQEASKRTGIPVDLLIAQARQESGFNPGATGGAGEVGIMQIHPKTAGSPGFGLSGVQNPDVLRDPRTNINFGADYLAARAKAIGADLTTPQGQAAALRAYNGGGDPNYVANVFRYVPPGGPAVATAGAPGSTTAARQPVVTGDSLASQDGLGGSGVVGDSPAKVLARVQAESRAGKYSGQPVVLSTGASNNPTDLASVEQQIREAQGGNAGKITVLGVGPAVEAKAPGTNAKLQALATSYGAQFVPLPTDQMSPDGVHPTAQGYAALKAAIAPSQGAPGGGGQSGRYQIAGPPVAAPGASTAPASGQPQAQIPQPPANRVMPGGPDGPPAPAQAPLPPLATGVNSPQYQQALQYLRQAAAIKTMPGYALNPRLQATAAWLEQQGQALAKMETFQEDTQGGVHGQRNVLTNQFTPDPARRMMATETGDVINDQGRVIFHVTPQALEKDVEGQYWYVPKYPTAGPGGTLQGAQPVPGNLPTPGLVEEQKHDAARLAELRKDTFAQAQGAAQTSALIGNAEQAMAAATKGNIPPGHFGPELLRITAAAKSLGIDLSPFGVDEKALAAGQVTREQLQQMNGAILRKMFPQRVTNVDLATTGAALPNYGLDPEALTANFRIYRAQADYDQARARDMLDYEAQHGGSLVGWEHQWVQKHGFSNGPLDNLFSDAQGGKLGTGGTGGKAAAPPAAGAVVKGHRFKGGDPSKQENWEPQ